MRKQSMCLAVNIYIAIKDIGERHHKERLFVRIPSEIYMDLKLTDYEMHCP